MVARSIRIFELVHYVSTRRGRRVSEIAERFDVSERTVFRDLADLQASHIPIYHDGRGYRLMETANLPPLNLTAQQYALLKVALHNPALRRQPALARTLEVLEGKLDAAAAQAEEHPRALQLAPVDRSGPKAAEALELLQIATERSESVEMEYASLSGGTTGAGGPDPRHPKPRRLDPWQLFQRQGAWYVIGDCHVNREPRIFRLDRVETVRGTGETFERPADFDLESFLKDTWGMVKGDGHHEIVLHFDPSLAPLILNARHHDGEETEVLDDGTIEYRVELSSLEEVARWVVGFGGECRVVEPRELRDRVVRLAEGALHGEEAI